MGTAQVLPSGYLASVSYPTANVKSAKSYTCTPNVTGSHYIQFSFRQDPAYWYMSNAGLTMVGGSSNNMLQNGNFATGGSVTVNGSPVIAPTGWGVFYQTGSQPVAAGTWQQYVWKDGAVGSFDGIYQGVTLSAGASYKISFDLKGDNPSNGVDVVVGVYCLPCADTLAPATLCSLPSTSGFVGLAVPGETGATSAPSPTTSPSSTRSNPTPRSSLTPSNSATLTISLSSTPTITGSASTTRSAGSWTMAPSFSSTPTITGSASTTRSAGSWTMAPSGGVAAVGEGSTTPSVSPSSFPSPTKTFTDGASETPTMSESMSTSAFSTESPQSTPSHCPSSTFSPSPCPCPSPTTYPSLCSSTTPSISPSRTMFASQVSQDYTPSSAPSASALPSPPPTPSTAPSSSASPSPPPIICPPGTLVGQEFTCPACPNGTQASTFSALRTSCDTCGAAWQLPHANASGCTQCSSGFYPNVSVGAYSYCAPCVPSLHFCNGTVKLPCATYPALCPATTSTCAISSPSNGGNNANKEGGVWCTACESGKFVDPTGSCSSCDSRPFYITLPIVLILLLGGLMGTYLCKQRSQESRVELEALMASTHPLRIPLMILGDHLARLALLNRVSTLVYPANFRWFLGGVGLLVGFNTGGSGGSCSSQWGWAEIYGLNVGLVAALIACVAAFDFFKLSKPKETPFVLWRFWDAWDAFIQFATQASWQGVTYGVAAGGLRFLWPEPTTPFTTTAYWVGLGAVIIALDASHTLFYPLLAWKYGQLPQLMDHKGGSALGGEAGDGVLHLRKPGGHTSLPTSSKHSGKHREGGSAAATNKADGSTPAVVSVEVGDGEGGKGEGSKKKGKVGKAGKAESGGGVEKEEGKQGPPPPTHWFLARLQNAYLFILRYVCRQRNERGHFGHYPVVFSNVSTHTPLDLTGIRLNEGRRLMGFLRGAAIATQPWFPSAAAFWLVASSIGDLVGLGFAYPLLVASSQHLIFLPLLAVSSFNHVTGVVCTLSPSSCYSASALGGILIAANCLLFVWLAYFPLAVWWKILAPGCHKLKCCTVMWGSGRKKGEGGEEEGWGDTHPAVPHTTTTGGKDPHPHPHHSRHSSHSKGVKDMGKELVATSKREAEPSPTNPSLSPNRREGLKKPSVRAAEGGGEEEDSLSPVFNAPHFIAPKFKFAADSKRDVPPTAPSAATASQPHDQHHDTHALSLGPSPGKSGGAKATTLPSVHHHKKDKGGV